MTLALLQDIVGRKPADLSVIDDGSGQANGLATWWPLDWNLRDLSGKGVNATGHNFATAPPTITSGWAADSFGRFLAFDGSDDYFDAAAPDAPYIAASGLSIFLWVWVNSGASSYQHFAGKHTSNGTSDNPFDFRTGADAVTLELIRARGTGNYGDFAGAALTKGKWNHIGFTVADNLILTVPVFYLNGVATTGTSLGGNGSDGAVTGSAANIRVGVRADSVVILNGKVADVRIYSRALNKDEVWRLYSPITRWQLRSNAAKWFLGGATAAPAGNLFRQSNLDGISTGGPFFANPLA